MDPSPVFDIYHFQGFVSQTVLNLSSDFIKKKKLVPSESQEKGISENIYSMIENVDCKRLDRTITCQHQGVFMFHICIRSLLIPTRKMKKKSLHVFNFLFHQTQVLEKRNKRSYCMTLKPKWIRSYDQFKIITK